MAVAPSKTSKPDRRGVRDLSTRTVRGPVGWLLGPELIGKLKKILRKRSDPRDWMPYYRGSVHDECWARNGALVRVVEGDGGLETGTVLGGAGQQTAQTAQSAERNIAVAPPPEQAPPPQDVWFDFIADMGDAVDSMYAVAYASMVSFDGFTDKATWASDRKPVTLDVAQAESGALPRGQFLFIGGDTAYHVADAPTLRSRVEEPFRWAFADAKWEQHVRADSGLAAPSRRLYGIPGNHDWYDNLEGFSLVFRLGSAAGERKPIALPDLERVQLASYVAIQLPFGWQFWGLDIDSPMDARQKAYFESLGEPKRLILATPSPAFVFNAAIPGEHHVEALAGLKIPLPNVPIANPDAVKPKYRLDLSGDVHHYARYYPRIAGDNTPAVDSYGSVVSGLGGAFHHPSFTRATGPVQKVEAVCEYPTCGKSLTDVAQQLLTWRSTWFGSWARGIPFLLTLLVGFSALYAFGGSWLIDHLWSVIPNTHVEPLAGGGTQILRALCATSVFVLAVGGVLLGLLIAKRAYRKQLEEPQRAQNIIDFWKNRRNLPRGFLRQLFSFSRSYWAAWTTASIFFAPLAFYFLWGADSRTLRLDIATLVILFVLPIAAALVGLRAAGDLDKPSKICMTVVGLFHGAAHVITAIVVARCFSLSWYTAAATLGAIVFSALMLYTARPLFKSQARGRITALALLALAVFGVSIGAIIYAAQGKVVVVSEASGWYCAVGRTLVSALAAMPLGTIWFIWYLAIAGRLNAHNNEVGGAARVTKYRQLIRFHVHEAGVTGYVISIENTDERLAVHAGGKNLKFELVDVFTVAAPAATAPVLSSVPAEGELEVGRVDA